MRTVVYDSEFMEPITVVDVPQYLFAQVQNGGFNEIILAVPPKLMAPMMVYPEPIKAERACMCRLCFEPVRKEGKILFLALHDKRWGKRATSPQRILAWPSERGAGRTAKCFFKRDRDGSIRGMTSGSDDGHSRSRMSNIAAAV